MSHGWLTPLGKQLRFVLATIRPAATRRIPPPIQPHVFTSTSSRARAYHAATRRRAAEATVASQARESDEVDEDAGTHAQAYTPFLHHEGELEGTEILPIDGNRDAPEPAWWPSQTSRSRINRHTRVDRITEALTNAGRTYITPTRIPGKPDWSHVNFRNREGWKGHRFNAVRHRNGPVLTLAEEKERTLSRILASYIQHQTETTDTGEADWEKPFQLLPGEEALLKSRGYEFNDLQAWSAIISKPDSLDAAKALDDRITTLGIESVPFFLFSYILRRQQINARALRMLIRQAWTLLDHRVTGAVSERLSENAVFVIFSRLLRHARARWPASMESLAKMLLHFLPRTAATTDKYAFMEQLERMSFDLNKAMRLIAVPTAIEPFKNNAYQEAALVEILRFMAEQDPPMAINREGYRAVILIQLAQRKTPSDRKWAELKALSWPPWKEDRTAMDADITREEHGLSKARETLERMREAGFEFLEWEKAAAIYTGWDTDQTPTVQTRVLLGTAGARFNTGAAGWAARITATRTVQEAWACYLAYEDQELPPDQDVYLAVFQKLYREEQRKEGKDSRKRSKQKSREMRLWPGDAQEIEPLPPSTHLYTYTRAPPPTVDEFYQQLRDRGVELENQTLAFVVAKAGSARIGMKYLHDHISRYPGIHDLIFLATESVASEEDLPRPIFAAFIALLGRFSKVPLSKCLPTELKAARLKAFHTRVLDGRNLNADHLLVHAIELLRQKRPRYRPIWNPVLRSLGHDSSFQNLPNAHELLDTANYRVDKKPAVGVSYQLKLEHSTSHGQQGWDGAVVAYRLVRRTISLMKESYVELDYVGFKALCAALENVTLACWLAMRHETSSGGLPDPKKPTPLLMEKRELMKSRDPAQRLKGEFRMFVGEDESSDTNAATQQPLHLPELIEIPSFAILHVYVRALGWHADHAGLLEAVRWMVKHEAALGQRRALDYNGETMMRRTIVALRVFLERAWLVSNSKSKGKMMPRNETERKALEARPWMKALLLTLESPAKVELVEEVRGLVDGVEAWGGWAGEEEVEKYCRSERFLRFK